MRDALPLLEQIRHRLPSLSEASSGPVVARMIRNAVLTLDETIKAKVKKWGADQVLVTASSHGIQVKVWLEGPEDEARDVVKGLLGSGATLVPHKLKPNYFVATIVYSLGDLF